MQKRKNGREYSEEIRLRRVRPHDRRTVRRRRRKVDKKTAIMIVITVFLVFVSGKAVFDLIRAQKKPDEAEAAQVIRSEGEEEKKVEIPPEKEIESLADNSEEDVPLVVIDPGHGGIDNGSNIDGIYEQEINMDISCLLADKLQDMGIETLLLREDNDTYLSLEERVDMAENAGADIYVSIHQNFYEGSDTTVSGLETWYCGKLEDSRRLAGLVHDGAVARTSAVDRGLMETDDLYVICRSSMPSCLVETGFLSNRQEREALLTKEYQEKLAEGIAEGIASYFQEQY